MPLLRCLQACTAAAALFALLGACGLAPPRSPRVVVRPRAPRTETTVRSLTGTWLAAWRRPDAVETLSLSLAQSGDAVTGTLAVQGRALASDPSRPARLDVDGRFALGFGQAEDVLVVRGRPDATGDRISASIDGLSTGPVVVTFRRH